MGGLRLGNAVARAQWHQLFFRYVQREGGPGRRHAGAQARTPSISAAVLAPVSCSRPVHLAKMLRACQLSGMTAAAQVSAGRRERAFEGLDGRQPAENEEGFGSL